MRKNKTKGTANEIDLILGQNLKLFRNLRGYSQEKLAEHVDITFQQIQKYEKGTNRIAASRLYAFSKILNVPLVRFYNDLEDTHPANIVYDISIQHFKIIRAIKKFNSADFEQALFHFLSQAYKA